MFPTLVCAWLLAGLSLRAAVTVSVVGGGQTGARWELRIDGVPTVSNPMDPDQVQVDVTIEGPDGSIRRVPAFWMQGYTRRLSGGSEVLSTSGSPGWRVRHWPVQEGTHGVSVTVATNGVILGTTATTRFEVLAGLSGAEKGPARVASSGQFFERADGRPLPLVGMNLCWPGTRGSFDYDDWLPRLASNGVNHVRLWMCPWAFGLETGAGTLNRYRQDRAVQLDRVFEVAEHSGVLVQLCLDYHGMFRTTPDPTWGGLDDWKVNPYAAALGGPATTPNAFFTQAAAVAAYRKRLRYLIARYSYSPHLFAWEFFNEIDNAFAEGAGALNPSDVAGWHADQAAWMATNDPARHLVTTSLAGADRSELWNLPGLQFVNVHSYGTANPAAGLAAEVARLRGLYGKPVVVGEFGVDYRGWMRASDPHLRGFRQNLWGAIAGGAAGTAMSWWWEELFEEDVVGLIGAVSAVTDGLPWGQGSWTPIRFRDPGAPPATVAAAAPDAPLFTARLLPGMTWGTRPRGTFAVPDPTTAEQASAWLNAFVHGSAHPDLRVPFRLHAAFGPAGRVKARVNSVSVGARLGFYVDGTLVTSTNLPDRDGRFDAFVNEYGIEVGIPVAAGLHTVEIRNPGNDWFTLDWVEVTGAMRTVHAGGWQPAPVAVGVARGGAALAYVGAPALAWPAGSTQASPEVLVGRLLEIEGWPAGSYLVRWHDPVSGERVAEASGETDSAGRLTLPLPAFAEDRVGWIVPRPRIQDVRVEAGGELGFEIDAAGAPPGTPWTVELSPDLVAWTAWNQVYPMPGQRIRVPMTGEGRFVRARP